MLRRKARGVSAAALLKQAIDFSRAGEYGRAENFLRKALQSKPDGRGPRPDRPTLWNELGMVCKYLGKFDSAERCYRLALRHVLRVKDPERDCHLANIYHNLGGLEHARRRCGRAERFARRGLQVRLRCASHTRLELASDRAALAAILDGLDRYSESKKLYRQALRTYYLEYGKSHHEIAVILNNLGTAYSATGRAKLATSYYLASLRMKRRELPASHPDLAITMNNLAVFHASRGSERAAARWFDKAIRALELSLGASHPASRTVRRNKARLLLATAGQRIPKPR